MVYLGDYSNGTDIVSLGSVNWPLCTTYHTPAASAKTRNSRLPAFLNVPPGRVEESVYLLSVC